MFLLSCFKAKENELRSILSISNNFVKNSNIRIKSNNIEVDEDGYIFNNNKLLLNYSLFNNTYSFLVDYFGNGNTDDGYLIIAPIPNSEFISSSDTVLLDRGELLLINLLSKSIYHVELNPKVKLMPKNYFDKFPSGLKLDEISEKREKVILKSKPSKENLEFNMVEIKNFESFSKNWLLKRKD